MIFLVVAFAVAFGDARLLSLDSDVTSARGDGTRVAVRRKQHGVEVELVVPASSLRRHHYSAHVLAAGVAGCAVTVRQFGREGGRVATAVEVAARPGALVSHAALLEEEHHTTTTTSTTTTTRSGSALRDIRVDTVLVDVEHRPDGGIAVLVWPRSGKTRWRAAVSAKLGVQQVLMHNTARIDPHTGVLRAGFEVVLPVPSSRKSMTKKKTRRRATKTIEETTETRTTTTEAPEETDPPTETPAPHTSHGVVLTDSEARDMEIASADEVEFGGSHHHHRRRLRRHLRKMSKSTTKTTTSATTTSTTTKKPTTAAATTTAPADLDDVLGLSRTKATIDLIKSVKRKEKKKESSLIFFFLESRFGQGSF